MKWVPYFFFFVCFTSSLLAVVPVEDIQAVRERTESASAALSEQDKAQIDKFILAALNDIFLSKTSEEMAKTRRQILEQKGTKDLSMYATAYLTILRDHLQTSAYQAIQRIEDPGRQLLVRRNLMILVAELRSLLLVQFGLERVRDPDAVIRYWAVKSLTNESIAQQLNSEVTNNPEAAAQIVEKLQVVIQEETLPEILALVSDFASTWNDPRAVTLLGQLAGRRIEAYKICSVRHPWLDLRILEGLAEKYRVQKLPDEKAQTARSFANLLAVVMQRFMQENAKSEEQKTRSEEFLFQFVTVLVETEERIFPKLEIPPAGIKRTIERNEDLKPVFDELFGTESRRGTLRTQLNFTYGQDETGNLISAPPALPPCPPAEAAETEGPSASG